MKGANRTTDKSKSKSLLFDIAVLCSFLLIRILLLFIILLPSVQLHCIGRIRSLLLSIFIVSVYT